MPLSEHEQRLLEEMERSLYQNDADFVAKVGGTRARPAYRSIVLGILIAVVGIAVLVTGVFVQQPLVGILVAIAPGKRIAQDPDATPSSSTRGAKQGKAAQAGFMNKLNDRWDKRQDGQG